MPEPNAPDELVQQIAEIRRLAADTTDRVLADRVPRLIAAFEAHLERHEQIVRQQIAEEIVVVDPDPGRLWNVNQVMAARATKEQTLKRITQGGPDV